jgi:predicted SAM-dependent methyltransferase
MKDLSDKEKTKVIVCNESPYNGKWFYVKDGIKRWITSYDAALEKGIDLSKIERVDLAEISKYSTGKIINKNITSIEEISNYYEAREYFVKDLVGSGIEFGAATTPTVTPDNCKVEYADYFKVDEGCNKEFQGDFVTIKYFTSLDEMNGIRNNSLDFIMNCHVIEHVSRTLLAIEQCYKKLKKHGILFMAIPHMNFTFDSLRQLTPLEHFIKDYKNYNKERDMIHVVDYFEHLSKYFSKQKGIEEERIDLYPVLDRFITGEVIDLHYHTFTEENFAQLLDYFNTNIARWRTTEIIPRIPFEGSNEFYVRLTK